ncbi:hypothetical protein P152DRAFT_475771 [Eremomyces bilateralis CBS 781.70]|uniref:Uncharacterized protein n=1 Tax=Eremomyces bilateralis CBS 781.70 TaxID=1392243 RepID=A0A6G1FWZ5_9PEZI|nr:uncharacterized protein P152DRAFT_475771 [Eremomyces bilateralis CBS 781.70]KAF1810200.1 hypothetical protein P152DRAFT_475771 [Eremomyces bilateralis CBS 781.70]
MAGKRYFILEETIAATEIESMMGRVVISKTLPLNKFAPFPAMSPNEPSHNTNDIIPSILPSPSLSLNRKEFFSAVRGHELHVALSAILAADIKSTREGSATLDSQQVKRYTLDNPEQYFRALLQNELYSRDMRTILEASSTKRGYFVTGFLTTTETTWNRETNRSKKGGFSTSLPVSQLTGLPLPVISDLRVGSAHESTTQHGQDMSVPAEEIFAMSYSIVKLEYNFKLSLANPIIKTPVFGPPKRAKARHLALSQESDEEIEDGSDDDDNKHNNGHVACKWPRGSTIKFIWDNGDELLGDIPGTSFLLNR